MDDSTPTTPQAETPLARTPINASESNLQEATAYVKALAAVEKLKLDSPSKACEASPCAAGGGAQASRSGDGAQASRSSDGAQASRSGDGAQASRSCRDCWRSFFERLSVGECPTPRPQKRRWSEVEQLASADASPAPSAPSTRDAN